MAYDGIVVNSIIKEIRDVSMGGRCLKVQQPDSETITLTMKGRTGQTKLFISISPSLPIVYKAETLPQAPMQAPAFCMLLRKHLQNGRLTDIRQPGFDRIFDFVFEHMDEMGDISERHLIVEIMGRQSNVILTDASLTVLDSLKRVMPDISSVLEGGEEKNVRIIYPGKQYTLPDSQGKIDPVDSFDKDSFSEKILGNSQPVSKAIFTGFTGFSKMVAEEIVYRAGLDSRITGPELSSEQSEKLYSVFAGVVEDIKAGNYKPKIYYIDSVPKDFHALSMKMYLGKDSTEDISGGAEVPATMSQTVIKFYEEKSRTVSLKSGSKDIRKLLTTLIERTTRKYDQQLSQMKDTEDRDKYRIWGELLNTYGYELRGGEDSLTCMNYYDNKEITIPLDTDLSASENSKKYFEKYNKKKRTFTALTEYLEKTKAELDYLLSVKHSLDIAENPGDIEALRRELEDGGFLRKSGKKTKVRKTESEPLHFVSSDGYDIYVGKNNIQNDYLTFSLASGKDIWFHSKQAPGSHVIVKLKDSDRKLEDIPDRVFEEAAAIAAYYSSLRDAPKVEIDYTERKNLKKPPGANPGYVIYHTNYSIMAEPRVTISSRSGE